MFPVSLENRNGEVWTTQPPCYGFMKKGTAGCYPYTFKRGISPASSLTMIGCSMRPTEAVPFNQLKYIWNSGTHLFRGTSVHNPDYDPNLSASRNNLPYLQPILQERSLSPRVNEEASNVGVKLDSLSLLANSLGITFPAKEDGHPWDYIDELKDIEKYFDPENDSIVVRHPFAYTMMGVDVEHNVPADRALNYLMLGRMFTTRGYDNRIRTYLIGRYQKDLTPAQAIILAALVGCEQDWSGNNLMYKYIGNASDSCIYPCYIIPAGIGAVYTQPTQVQWIQDCYCDMTYSATAGHLRDSIAPKLRLREHRTGEVKEQYGAMLMAIFSHRAVTNNWKTIPIAMMEKYNPTKLRNIRNEYYSRDVQRNSSSSVSTLVQDFRSFMDSGINRENTNLLDAVIEIMNNPLENPNVQP